MEYFYRLSSLHKFTLITANLLVILWTIHTSNIQIPLRRGVVDNTLCHKVCQWLAAGRWFSLGTSVSSTNKTDRHDITVILNTLALNTKNSHYTEWSVLTPHHYTLSINLNTAQEYKNGNEFNIIQRLFRPDCVML
jgi:hypothetical protein